MSTSSGVRDGWAFVEKNIGSISAAQIGEDYVNDVDATINRLTEDINAKAGSQESVETLKGFIAEYWHADTFNIDAALNDSEHKMTILRSNEMGSADVVSNSGDRYSMKYYATGIDSAKQQAVNITQAYHKYLAKSNSEHPISFEEYKAKYGFTNDFDAVYEGQGRVIPTDQLNDAIAFLKRQIAEEQARGGHRTELLKDYVETFQKLTDRIKDSNGVESIPLTKEEAKAIAAVCKSGKFKPEDFGIKLDEIITTEYILQQALKAGYTAATITLVLQLAPEVYKAIDSLIRNGQVDEEQLRKIGFTALSASAKGFIRGSIASSLTIACQSGRLGAQYMNLTPTQIGAMTVIAVDAIRYSFDVASGKMTRQEMSVCLAKEILVSSVALAGGALGQAVLPVLPVIGYWLGSFIGSVVASKAIAVGETQLLSLCVDTGYTFFGLVDQDYTLPKEAEEYLGLKSYKVRSYEPRSYKVRSYEPRSYKVRSYEPKTLNIVTLRRGIIGVNKIGYVVV
jgi:hypothetical protein